jgi:hypothetical protein
MKKPKPPTIDEIEKEIKVLLVSKSNDKRLKELQKKIDFFNWGIE